MGLAGMHILLGTPGLSDPAAQAMLGQAGRVCQHRSAPSAGSKRLGLGQYPRIHTKSFHTQPRAPELGGVCTTGDAGDTGVSNHS